MTRFPETLGIYESMLDMSICRGDLPSAKLAFRAISLFSKYPVDTLVAVLSKASLLHFSALPEEILRLDMDDAWMIISGMCEADLDKRAYSIASLYIRGINDPIIHNFMRAKTSLDSYTSPAFLSTYLDKLLYEVVLSMNRRLPDKEYFQYSGVAFDDIENTSIIRPEYYLGSKSWIYDFAVDYVFHTSKLSRAESETMIGIMEHHYTYKLSYYEADYWRVLKNYVLKNNDMENLWITSLRKKVLSLIDAILETRLPTQMRG